MYTLKDVLDLSLDQLVKLINVITVANLYDESHAALFDQCCTSTM